MDEQGYERSWSAASVSAAAVLAMLIPPSNPSIIIYCGVTETPGGADVSGRNPSGDPFDHHPLHHRAPNAGREDSKQEKVHLLHSFRSCFINRLSKKWLGGVAWPTKKVVPKLEVPE